MLCVLCGPSRLCAKDQLGVSRTVSRKDTKGREDAKGASRSDHIAPSVVPALKFSGTAVEVISARLQEHQG